MTQPIVREYQTAEEALEGANRWIADLTRRLYEAQGSLFGVKPDRGQPVPVQFAVRNPQPEPSEFLRGLGIMVGDTVKLKNGDTGKVTLTNVLCSASNREFIYGNREFIYVELSGRDIAYSLDGWPQNDSLCRYLEDVGLPRDSSVSDFRIVSITRDKTLMEQISFTNWPETLKPDYDSEKLRLAYEQAVINSQPEFDRHQFNYPPIVAGMEFE